MRRFVMLRASTCAVSMLLAGLVSVPPARAGQLPATGQTQAYQADKNDGIPSPVDVPDDGTLQQGAPLRYKLLKDGTVKDLNTGLIWEVKCVFCSGIHMNHNTYVWSGDGTQETIWDWLDKVNSEGGTGYAGHSDWRIPNIRELQSIVDYGEFTPKIDPIFGTTERANYWSSTARSDNPSLLYVVYFNDGDIFAQDKNLLFYVRAVRGGPK